jgi:hypothetical protein
MRDSPSTDSAGDVRGGDIGRQRWERMVLVAGLGGAIVLGLFLVWHYWH